VKWLYLVEVANIEKLLNKIGSTPFFVLHGQECKISISLLNPILRFESSIPMNKRPMKL
jgi:hypothetical protein